MKIDSFSISNIGGRANNEDSVFSVINSNSSCGVFVVADGLGGHSNGELASRTVTESVSKCVNFKQLFWDKKIKKWLELSQKELLTMQNNPQFNGAKTTATILTIKNKSVRYVYVGDTRLYKFRADEVIFQTEDHSVPQMLFNSGEIQKEDIRHHEDRNKLLRVLGVDFEKDIYSTGNIEDSKVNDSFLVCSDGFWEWIDEKDMILTRNNSNTAKEWLEKMETIILENSKNAAYIDNFSAIAVILKD